MADVLKLLLPTTLTVLSIPFFVLWKWGVRAAGFWGLGYLFWALCHFLLTIAGPLRDPLLSVFALSAFILSLFFQMHGLQVWAGKPRMAFRTRVFICICGIALVALSVQSADLKWLQMQAQLATRLSLTGCALFALFPRIRHLVDRLLFIAVTIVTLAITIGSILLIRSTLQGSGGAPDELIMAMQVIGNASGIAFALAALGAVVIEMIAKFRNDAMHDPMTGLLNRRGFQARVPMLGGGQIGGGVIICDIDYFKKVNDSFGHDAGDLAIVVLANIIRDRMPVGSIAARLGGEEFVIWLPGANIAQVRTCAEVVREGFASNDWAAIGIDHRLTVSCGGAVFLSANMSMREIMRQADEALYASKGAGRNQVTLWMPRPRAGDSLDERALQSG